MKKIEEIEVKDARVCSGACKTCVCKDPKEMITFNASHWADAENSVAALVIPMANDGWHSKEWFPKKICTFSEIRPYGRFEITAPRWLLEKKKIINNIRIVKNED